MRLTKTILVVALSGISSCGSSVEQASFSLDETKILSELEPNESKEVCEEIQRALRGSFTKEMICRILASTQHTSSQVCSGDYDDCVARAKQPFVDVNCDVTYSYCDASVGEMQRCFNDSLVYTDAFYSDASCTNRVSIQGWRPPASCVEIEDRCRQATRTPLSGKID